MNSRKFRCRILHRPHARTLSRTKNVRVSDGDPRRNQPHPNEDDKPPGWWFLRSSSHLAILPPNTLRHYGRYIRSSSLGPSLCPYSPECVEWGFSEVRVVPTGSLRRRGAGRTRAPAAGSAPQALRGCSPCGCVPSSGLCPASPRSPRWSGPRPAPAAPPSL